MIEPLARRRPARVAATASVSGVALAVGPLALAAQEEGGSAIFSIEPGLVIWTWILFLVTLGILSWKVFPAISGGLEERHAKIQGAIDEARQARVEAEGLLARQRAALDEAKQESQAILERARQAGEGLRKEILEEARTQHTAMLEEARREIALERDRLREDVRTEAAEVALAVAERLMRTRLDAEENRRLVHEFVSEL